MIDKTIFFNLINLFVGSRGPTPPQQPNRKSPTLDQSTQVPSGSPEKPSQSQPRPDLRRPPPQRPQSTMALSEY
jgi:hypothetical protein